jgi:hypothetical protein
MSPTVAPPVIRAALPGSLDPRWSRLPGLEADGSTVTLGPGFWFRFENPSWLVCAWPGVRDDLLPVPGLEAIGPAELKMLREAATLMALNKVEADGHISNISPAWFFGVAVPLVFGLDERAGQVIDEAYHGTWFNESRRVESVKAHAALGGRLVHGCQSYGNLSGGVVAPYGTDISAFRAELGAMRAEWVSAVREPAT